MERAEIIATLRGRADEAQAICAGLSDEEMRRRPTEDEWSLLEICCHVRDAASIGGTRIRRLVEEDNPAIAAYDEQALAAEHEYPHQDPHTVLVALRAYWSGLAYELEGLRDGDWERAGTHPERGRVTVWSQAERQVRHTAGHLEQMRAVRAAIRPA